MSADELSEETADAETATETTDAETPEVAEALPEGDVEGQPGEGTEGADKAKEQPSKKDLPPTLRAAIRHEEKARKLKADAEAKAIEARRLHETAQQREQYTQAQIKQWQDQVNPKLHRLATIERAAANGEYTALVSALGLDPRKLLDGLAEEAANPMPEHVRRELDEARRFREQAKARESEQAKHQAEEQRQARLRADDRHLVTTSIEVAGEAVFPGLARYRGEHGDEALMREAYQLRDQLVASTGKCTTPDLLRELDKRARALYKLGGVAPKSTTPAQGTGPGKPGNPASPAATPQGKRPGAIRAGMAAEGAGKGRELTDAERRELALAKLREGRIKSK